MSLFTASTLVGALITPHLTPHPSLVREETHSLLLILLALNAWSGNPQKTRCPTTPSLPLQPVFSGLYLEATALWQGEYSHG